MLKTAFDYGIKQAYDDAGLTEDQMAAAQRLGGIGGGLAGAGVGGALGSYLGGRAANAFDVDPSIAHLLGAGLGAVAGGGLGGYAGTQIPKLRYRQEEGVEEDPGEESALGALPISDYDYLGLTPDYGYDDGGYGYGYEY